MVHFESRLLYFLRPRISPRISPRMALFGPWENALCQTTKYIKGEQKVHSFFMAQGKYWIITDFNHEINYDTAVDAFWTSKNIVWSKGQLEMCGDTQRLHWQFCIGFEKKVRLRTVKTVLGDQVHAELCRSDAANNYVWKDETSQGRRWEYGT